MHKYWYVILGLCFSYTAYTSHSSSIDPDAIIALWEPFQLDLPNPKMIIQLTDPIQNYIDLCTNVLDAIDLKFKNIEKATDNQIIHYKNIATNIIQFLTQEVPKHALGNLLPPANEHIPVIQKARAILNTIDFETTKRNKHRQLQDTTVKIIAIEKKLQHIHAINNTGLYESKKQLQPLKKILVENFTPTEIINITKYDLIQKTDLLLTKIDQELNDRSLIKNIILEEPTSPISKKTRSNLTPSGLSSSSSTPIVDELDLRSPVEIKTPRSPQ